MISKERLERINLWNDYLSVGVGFAALVFGPVIIVRALFLHAVLYGLVGVLFLLLGLYRVYQFREYLRRRRG